jgi:hypothetical protein
MISLIHYNFQENIRHRALRGCAGDCGCVDVCVRDVHVLADCLLLVLLDRRRKVRRLR